VRRIENYAFSFPVDRLSEPFQGPSLILTGRQDAGVGYRDAWAFLEQYPREVAWFPLDGALEVPPQATATSGA
jgi:hypothetical protein